MFDNLLIVKQALCEFIDIERQKEFYFTMLYRRNTMPQKKYKIFGVANCKTKAPPTLWPKKYVDGKSGCKNHWAWGLKIEKINNKMIELQDNNYR